MVLTATCEHISHVGCVPPAAKAFAEAAYMIACGGERNRMRQQTCSQEATNMFTQHSICVRMR